jgi:hypothetical protein
MMENLSVPLASFYLERVRMYYKNEVEDGNAQ